MQKWKESCSMEWQQKVGENAAKQQVKDFYVEGNANTDSVGETGCVLLNCEQSNKTTAGGNFELGATSNLSKKSSGEGVTEAGTILEAATPAASRPQTKVENKDATTNVNSDQTSGKGSEHFYIGDSEPESGATATEDYVRAWHSFVSQHEEDISDVLVDNTPAERRRFLWKQVSVACESASIGIEAQTFFDAVCKLNPATYKL